MRTSSATDEDWELLKSFFPPDWRELAQETGALKGLRQDKSEENYLRTLMIHAGCGCSLRETVTRARLANLADLSDVALLKRLRKSKDWLYELCCRLFQERQLDPPANSLPQVCLVDGTIVREPGRTGSQWRIHYALGWPSLKCHFFKLTPTQGQGVAEGLGNFPFQAGDHVLADRGYCHAEGIHEVHRRGAKVAVRLNPQGIRLLNAKGGKFDLLQMLSTIQRAGQAHSSEVRIPCPNQPSLPARLCVIRKSQEAIQLARKRLLRKASKNGTQLQPQTLIYAEYVMVLTTFDPASHGDEAVLEWYRVRWQVELVFKRLKQLAQLGHLPKHDEESSKAWLYGKLFVALLTEKLIEHARAFSPWGYPFKWTKGEESVVGVQIHVPPGHTSHRTRDRISKADGMLE